MYIYYIIQQGVNHNITLLSKPKWIFPNDIFDESLKDIALKIANQSKPLAKLAKEAVNVAYETTLEEGIRSERALFYSTFALEDHVEGMEAFSEKRKPVWNNK